MSEVIAIVGRPNVGKSALFNRLVGKRIAIVHDEPGVTRDRISAEAEWQGRAFTLVDTGGIGLLRGEKTHDVLTQAAQTQVQLAIESAQVILLVVNAQEGLAPLDIEVAARLRRAAKPVVVAVNKADQPQSDAAADEFASLGFAARVPVSAIHDRGIPALMKAALALLPASEPPPILSEGQTQSGATSTPLAPSGLGGPLKLAIVGRPNVGKSSLVNALTQSERVIVTPIPGTTRDAIDVPFEVETDGVRQQYVLIDTAGLRKRRRVDDSIEFFSITRAEESVHRCDITLFILDAATGILEQDKKVADLIVAAHKACIVVVNKWDLAVQGLKRARTQVAKQRRQAAQRHDRPPKVLTTLAEFGRWVQEQLFFLDYAPVIFTSATEGFNLTRLLEAVRYVAAQLTQKVPTSLLNRTLQQAIEQRQPVSASGHQLKVYYATQTGCAPPTFRLFVNRADLFSTAYNKYLAKVLRQAYGFEGCPLLLQARPRPKPIAPKRTR